MKLRCEVLASHPIDSHPSSAPCMLASHPSFVLRILASHPCFVLRVLSDARASGPSRPSSPGRSVDAAVCVSIERRWRSGASEMSPIIHRTASCANGRAAPLPRRRPFATSGRERLRVASGVHFRCRSINGPRRVDVVASLLPPQ